MTTKIKTRTARGTSLATTLRDDELMSVSGGAREIVVTKPVDSSSSKLYDAAAAGTRFSTNTTRFDPYKNFKF